jgi:hypothetical protein
MCGTERIERAWQHAIHEYGKRSLTYHTDRLPALSGDAARFQPLFNTKYCAGLCRGRMVLELAWEHVEILTWLTSAIPPSLENSVPSWSWASISGSVFYEVENHFSEVTVQYSLIDVDCEPSTDNPLGGVLPRSSVQIEGRYVPAMLMANERGFAVIGKPGLEPQLVMPDCQLIETSLTIGDLEMPTLRRALPAEKFVPEEGRHESLAYLIA